MKIIKHAIVFNAELPTADALRTHLAAAPFVDPLELQSQSVGFVPRQEDGDLVTEIKGGLAFSVRIDKKIVPSSAVNAEINKQVKALGRRVGRKERAELKELVVIGILKRALITTAVITCFYDRASNFLIIPVTSRNIAGIITSALIHAVGSVKTTTLHVSEVKSGLTQQLQIWMDVSSEAFGDFTPCGEVVLQSAKQTMSVKLDHLGVAQDGITEALKHGFHVNSLRLQHCEDGMSFRLTSDFQLKGITFDHGLPDEDGDAPLWNLEAGEQIERVARSMTSLCAMFAYKETPADPAP